MKYAYAILLAAGLVAAQDPACATPCFSSAFSAVGCAETNSACICASQSAIQSVAVPCLLAACDQSDLQSIEASAGTACDAYSSTAAATATATSVAATTTATETSTETGVSSNPGGLISTASATSSASSNSTVTSASPTATETSGASNFVAVGGLGSVLALVAAAVVAL